MFFKWAKPGFFLCIFVLFTMQRQIYCKFAYVLKALMVCLGHEPRAGRWKAQTSPLSSRYENVAI